MNFHNSDPVNSNYSLYSVSLQVGYDQQLKNPAWRRTILFLPKFNGDFINLSRSFQPGGFLMFTYKKSDNMKYHFAFYYNRECFGDYFLPLLGIDWKINSHMNLFIDLPNNLSFEFKISPAMTLGTGFIMTISSFRVHQEDATSYIREGNNILGHDQLKVYLNYFLTEHFIVYAEAGQTFNRKYIGYDSDNNIMPSSSIKTYDGMLATGGLAYCFVLE